MISALLDNYRFQHEAEGFKLKKILWRRVMDVNDRGLRRIITIEDGVRMGGMGSAVLEWMNDHDYQPKMTRMGLPDEFVEHGTVAQLREIVHLDKESIKEAIKK
mgnify:CR=1 FL=1